ncbi:hypothetical protein [Puia dinghuensis]|uniref:BZIP transcription factor n=1 Tax=Puia dinghuensis TaxID=1792502 RepID=A0A8J2U9Q4_9BACT|nr:hypothetical protein [Puia dinghuensis]GGA87944.1 hypothetical protein GCM10011511_08840 [Puia dinghuensis]
MKRLSVLFFAFTWQAALCQWQTSGNNIYNSNTGNVGIGTSSPTFPLHLIGSVNDILGITASGGGRGGIYIQNTNAIGFATLIMENNLGGLNSTVSLSVGGSTNSYPNFFGLSPINRGNLVTQGANSLGLGVGTLTAQPLVLGTNNAERLRIDSAGNVGIGTSNTQGYKLAVNGSAIFTAAWVKPYANWPDYVFRKDYRLPSLDSLSKYIQSNNHLPDVPSAETVAQKGIDLGGNQAVLLKKIEELTLYLIEQQKAMEKQEKEIAALKEQNAQLQAQQERIDRLEQLVEQLSKKERSTAINPKP